MIWAFVYVFAGFHGNIERRSSAKRNGARVRYDNTGHTRVLSKSGGECGIRASALAASALLFIFFKLLFVSS